MPQNEFSWVKGELPPGAILGGNITDRTLTDNTFIIEETVEYNTGRTLSFTPTAQGNPFLNNDFLSSSKMNRPYTEESKAIFFLERADQGSLQVQERLDQGTDINPFIFGESITSLTNLNWSVTSEEKIPLLRNYVEENARPIQLPDPNTQYIPAYRSNSTILDGPTESQGSTPEITQWKFITSPGGISWSKEGSVQRGTVYGTNQPYQVYGFTSLRQLSLTKCLIEGFTQNKVVEDHVLALESLMQVQINKSNGFASPYVWRFVCGEKTYGYFLITKVSVEENLRNFEGDATRATVDIELIEVPLFQINDGRDLAAKGFDKNSKNDKRSNKEPVIQNGDNGTTPEDKFSEEPILSTKEGTAAWTGDTGSKYTFSGEAFDPEALKAAHPSLPMGSIVRVINQKNGKSTILTINDRIPQNSSREIVVSRKAARQIEMIDQGVTNVKVEVIKLGNDRAKIQ